MFSNNIETNIGAKFLALIDKHFPRSNPLSKIFSRNSVKISYKCTPNLAKIISGHNSKLIRQEKNPANEKTCSCPKNNTCPLDGQCLARNIVYQATVTEANGHIEDYIGLTAPTFKTRLGNHIKSFNHEQYSKDSKLSIHIWDLKKQNIQYTIKWKWKLPGQSPSAQ